ncbi:hypothetical protein BDD14_5399 [Edaphobacter modestus]|uniref:Uncharacterized protein n=1 Tax=Edaphobacter modestus TaxID=388466 RepID=A0A4Q7Z203_9BACT|nr:hypothetical protein BDD14_5399 [Edaphobacter modestus]
MPSAGDGVSHEYHIHIIQVDILAKMTNIPGLSTEDLQRERACANHGANYWIEQTSKQHLERYDYSTRLRHNLYHLLARLWT